MVYQFELGQLAIAAAIVTVAGLTRGITGFGGSLVMTPPLSLLLGPYEAVAAALILETVAALQFLPEVMTAVRWRTIVPISAAAAVSIPLGGYFLVTLDRDVVRRLIASVVILFSLALLRGVRRGDIGRTGTSVGVGLLSGTMLGATGIGAPPVILYLLSGTDPVAVTRANLTTYVTIISALGLLTLSANGVLNWSNSLFALLLAPFFLFAMWVGGRVFARLTPEGFRRATLVALIIVSGVILVI